MELRDLLEDRDPLIERDITVFKSVGWLLKTSQLLPVPSSTLSVRGEDSRLDVGEPAWRRLPEQVAELEHSIAEFRVIVQLQLSAGVYGNTESILG